MLDRMKDLVDGCGWFYEKREKGADKLAEKTSICINARDGI
ncbi:MAG TPA: hypothetical protein P5515_03535 [Methanolinea sp.]|nr:hypothetical protein [Methanolinea sp.]